MDSEGDEESQDSQVIGIGILPVELSTQSLNSVSGTFKGKYYRQTYRAAWEQMPDFKGWLRGVQGEPTRAYCTYCQKTLHAHRLSLLKHTCTIRHQKAAQIHNIRKDKNQTMNEESTVMVGPSGDHKVELIDSSSGDYTEQTIVAINDLSDMQQEQDDEGDEEEEEETETETITIQNLPVQFQKQLHQQNVPISLKPPISTHVLDTARGHPISGLQVSLYKLIEGRWTYINEGLTSSDGRFSNFIDRNDFTPGRYKLHYDVDRYFDARKQDTLYPFIEVVFDCRVTNDHYHVPLLLSPFGYTTYKGS